MKDIQFDKGPKQDFFKLKDGKLVSIARYFYQSYKLKVTEDKQPMLLVWSQGKMVKIPSEFCLVDGVPTEIKNNG